jgi:23S rRNA (uridine2552-2'-O)-methyltransferase
MTRWYSDKKHEHFYKQAKKDGYRARSAYKLKQINRKFNLINENDTVVDLGAAPGGWSQVAKDIVGPSGQVIGIDLLSIRPIEGITFLKGDMTKQSSLDELVDVLSKSKADIVISDMSPDISGNYSVDQARSIYLCEQALVTSEIILKLGGNFITKVFAGEDLPQLVEKIKASFDNVKQYSPPASRKSSSEVYIIAKNKK